MFINYNDWHIKCKIHHKGKFTPRGNGSGKKHLLWCLTFILCGLGLLVIWSLSLLPLFCLVWTSPYGLFKLPDTNADSDYKPDRYLVPYRKCSHCRDSDLDPYPNSEPQSLGCESVSGNVNKPLCLIYIAGSGLMFLSYREIGIRVWICAMWIVLHTTM